MRRENYLFNFVFEPQAQLSNASTTPEKDRDVLSELWSQRRVAEVGSLRRLKACQ